jgi:hypothetical protein
MPAPALAQAERMNRTIKEAGPNSLLVAADEVIE